MALRILHTIPSLNAEDGGPARSAPSLAAAQSMAGADVVMWSGQAATIELDEFQGVRFVSGHLPDVVSSGWKPDVIHDHGLWLPSNHASARLGRHNRIPRVVSPRGMLEPWCLKHRRLRKNVAWRLYQHRDLLSTSCLHATSERESEQFRRLGFRQPVILQPNGVQLPENGSLSQEIKKHPDKREILFLSRIHTVKGLENLIQAWCQVRRPSWKVTITGTGDEDYRQKLKKLVDSTGLRDSVSIGPGDHSSEKWRRLRQADVVVLPSYSENFGIVVAEALGVATPVITTTGTPWRQLRDQGCGWCVAPTVSGISSALKEAMNCSPDELQHMGQLGRAWVLKSFAWKDIGQRMCDSYLWLLGRQAEMESANPDTVSSIRRAA